MNDENKTSLRGQHFYQPGESGPKSNEGTRGPLWRWLGHLFLKRDVIYGCELNGNKDTAYLTRWTLWQGPKGQQLLLHIFHTSDHARELHNHPWDFWSLILWRGYWERSQTGLLDSDGEPETVLKWFGPLSFRFCPAHHAHRVILDQGKRAITLVWTGPKKAAWGFFTSKGWLYWKDYFRERKC